MGFVGGPVGEPFVANFAEELLFSRVDHLVVLQVGDGLEGFPAFANVRPVLVVDDVLVPLEDLATVENLSTHPTVEHLLDVGHLVVVGQTGGVVERPGTQLALVSGGLLRRLGQGVLLQINSSNYDHYTLFSFQGHISMIAIFGYKYFVSFTSFSLYLFEN